MDVSEKDREVIRTRAEADGINLERCPTVWALDDPVPAFCGVRRLLNDAYALAREHTRIERIVVVAPGALFDEVDGRRSRSKGHV